MGSETSDAAPGATGSAATVGAGGCAMQPPKARMLRAAPRSNAGTSGGKPAAALRVSRRRCSHVVSPRTMSAHWKARSTSAARPHQQAEQRARARGEHATDVRGPAAAGFAALAAPAAAGSGGDAYASAKAPAAAAAHVHQSSAFCSTR